jgi:DNA-binding transcriptional LysR family regulator
MPAENGRGMVATPYALTLQQPLRAALDALNQAVAQTPAPFDPGSAKRTFRIAGNDNSITMIMMSLLRQIDQAGGPDLKLAFVPHDLNRIVGQMERGEIDLLAGGPRFAPDALRIRRITQTRYRMAQRKAIRAAPAAGPGRLLPVAPRDRFQRRGASAASWTR